MSSDDRCRFLLQLDTITNYTGFCESEIRHTVKVICGKMEPRGGGGQQNLPRLNLSQVNVKYHRESYSSVSSYVSPDPSHLNLLWFNCVIVIYFDSVTQYVSLSLRNQVLNRRKIPAVVYQISFNIQLSLLLEYWMMILQTHVTIWTFLACKKLC